MQDHGDLVYLDVQKTGSVFVALFLRAACTLPVQHFHQHAPMVGERRPGAFYVITARHPVAQYISLYRYGVDGNGGVARRIRRAGRGELYAQGLDPWLAYILDPANAAVLREGFGEAVGSGIGFLSFRFLRLALADAKNRLPTARSLEDVRALYEAHRLPDRVIRNETLNDQLRTLALEEVPQWFDPAAVETYLAGAPANASHSAAPQAPSPALLAEIHRREAFLLDAFYGGAA